MPNLKAYKRITVEFFHEVDGKQTTGSMDFVLECNTGISYERDAFDSHIVGVLEQAGMVKPRVASIYHRIAEPPLLEL